MFIVLFSLQLVFNFYKYCAKNIKNRHTNAFIFDRTSDLDYNYNKKREKAKTKKEILI